VLIVRLDEIGDITMTTSFLRELRRNIPDAWMTLVVKPAVHNLVGRCPYVNEVLSYDWNAPVRFPDLYRHGRALGLAWRHLVPRRFDLAILPRWDADHHHASFIAYLSGARWRVAYSENVIAHKQRLNRGYDSLFTHVLRESTLKHEVEHSLDVIRFLGGRVEEDRLELWLQEEDEAYAAMVLKESQVVPEELLIGVGPSGGNSPLKQWPVDCFIELGRRIRAAYPSRVVVVGGPGEEALGAEIHRALGPSTINTVGKTTLRQTAALLKRCDIYVGNDAGPMHMAVALGVPVVALFGASCPHRFGPWGSGHRVLWQALPCSPCFQEGHVDRCSQCIYDRPHCILGIPVDEVQQAVEQMLQRKWKALHESAHAER
jgi:heptosyltransferase-2